LSALLRSSVETGETRYGGKGNAFENKIQGWIKIAKTKIGKYEKWD